MQEERLWNKNGAAASITWKDWFKLDCLSFLLIIPFLGPILLFGIYLFLLFNKETAVSIRSRIKANFIWTLISLIISLIVLVVYLIIYLSTGTSIV